MRRRILLAILLAVAVTGVALGIPLGVTGWLLVDNLTREDLASSAQRIAAILDDQLADGRPLDLSHVRVAVPKNGNLTVVRPDTPTLRYGRALGPDVVVETVPIAQNGTVRLAIPAQPMRTQQTQVAAAVLLLVVLSVGTGTVVATVTARRLARPLRHVADRAVRLGAGDFRPDSRRYDVAELDAVADALDASATALAQLVQRERQLVGDVSHQLRSRLTALQLRLEALTTHPDEEVADSARTAQEQADRLAAVLDELLAAARAASEVRVEPVDLSVLLGEVADEWRPVFKRHNRSLRLRVGEGLRARATPGRLREVLGVLLDNSAKHGAGTVTVTARRGESENTVVVQVADTGTGIPDDLASHVFERGFSGSGSTGVGLALARALAEADGGRLELSAKRPATFSLFLRVPRPSDVVGVSWPAERVPR
ncbi:ATP-binding protein [Saccharomonospora xinjiangensis]|uniref:ATP-binding protein n=1 Tax=Saccharomonospora xinjiangensis TaxID=75294 RepID=UPI00106FE933|nr:ATP-binding protein [Saccharomonospora xinjiangensis]QBQ59050.1 Osmolarity sensor protein EnvZ [Saccharomonospora xinjiangensis]